MPLAKTGEAPAGTPQRSVPTTKRFSRRRSNDFPQFLMVGTDRRAVPARAFRSLAGGWEMPLAKNREAPAGTPQRAIPTTKSGSNVFPSVFNGRDRPPGCPRPRFPFFAGGWEVPLAKTGEAPAETPQRSFPTTKSFSRRRNNAFPRFSMVGTDRRAVPARAFRSLAGGWEMPLAKTGEAPAETPQRSVPTLKATLRKKTISRWAGCGVDLAGFSGKS